MAAPGVSGWRRFQTLAGPALIVSLGYLDPGNLESDLQSGAYAGYEQIGILFWSTLLGVFLQVLAARLGVVSRRGLAEHCRGIYGKYTSLTLWSLVELAIIGADIQQIVGSAIALQILFGWDLWVGCVVIALAAFGLLALQKSGGKRLELIFAGLIGIMAICFFTNLTLTGFEVESALKRLVVPRVRKQGTTQALATLGAVVMPHNLFLHASLVVPKTPKGSEGSSIHETNKFYFIETSATLFISFLINAAVVCAFAVRFYDAECSRAKGGPLARLPDGTCGEIGLTDSGLTLEHALGESAKYVWALGLLAAGLSSTMSGVFAGQAVMLGFLDLKIAPWKRVVVTRAVALVPSLAVALWASTHDEHFTDRVDQLINVSQSVILPFALIPLLVLTSSAQVMTPEFVNSRLVATAGWAAALLAVGLNFGLLVIQIEEIWHKHWVKVLVVVFVATYAAFVAYVSWFYDVSRLELLPRRVEEEDEEEAIETNLQAPLLDEASETATQDS